MMIASMLSVLFAFSAITVDPAGHSVTFTAKATDVPPGTMLEFLFVGPDSDHAYEAAFVTDAGVGEIADAFDRAGIPRGNPIGQRWCRFWPAGKTVEVRPDLWRYVRDARHEPHLPVVFTGGSRDAGGVPNAATNMPQAVFALYSLSQSLMLFDDNLDQSTVYGRFVSTAALKSGERIAFTVSWDGKSGSEHRDLPLEPGQLAGALNSLKGAKAELDVTPVFSEALTVAEAIAAAKAISTLDSRQCKFNGFKEGQFYYRGFLPDEAWRNRKDRLTQPIEARLSSAGETYTLIDEDWNVEGIDPKLTAHDEPLEAIAGKFKGDTCFFYVNGGERLSRIYAVMRKLPKSIRNWYVYVD